MTGLLTSFVQARDIVRRFGDRVVLDHLDLDIARSEFVVLLGPSGCGKSTLLRLLAGLDRPDAGEIRVPADRAIVFQAARLLPWEKAWRNVTIGLKGPDARQRALAALAEVGLADRADAWPKTLSGGEAQRVALARALVADPSLVLLDEPFAALDAGLRERVREDIAAVLRATGTTAVLVTHDQAEALSLADEVALLIDGTVAQAGPPADVYHRPATLAAARFVGATVEFAGRAQAGQVEFALGRHPARLPVPDGPVTVVVRPEELVPDGGSVPATVTAVRFYGARSALRLRLADGTELTATAPGRSALAAGDRVGIGPVGPVLAYPSPAGG